MAKRQEVFFREWELGRGTELTLENLKEETREITNASGLDRLDGLNNFYNN